MTLTPGAIIFAVFVFVALMMLALAGRIGPRCRCWHLASMHRGPNTECSGRRPGEKNSLGIAGASTPCPCTEYRRTALSWWRRELHGTEEYVP